MLGVYGIVVAIIGTLYLSLSSFEYTGMSVGEYHPLLLDVLGFRISMWIVLTGFTIEFFEKFWDDVPVKFQAPIFYILIYFSAILIVFAGLNRIFGILY